eukprot:5849235-Amphidinium_carterae.1
MLLSCGGCCFLLAVMQLKKVALPMYGRFARARSAWHETCQQQNRCMLASCVLLPLYSSTLLLACTVAADHFRYHVVGMRVPLAVQLVAFLHLGFYQSAERFHGRHAVEKSMGLHPPKKAGVRL